MVAYSLIDGAAVDSLIWEYLNSTNPSLTSRTRIIRKSEAFGIPPVVVPSSLDETMKENLRQLFLNIHTEEKGRKIIEKLHIDKYVLLDDQRYDSIRKMQSVVSEQ
jgi:phosphonate transport system substrate-binding protein